MEQQFWTAFHALLHDNEAKAPSQQQQQLPPWIRACLAGMSPAGIAAVAAVLHCGVCFRGAIQAAADRRREQKRAREVQHTAILQSLEAAVDAAIAQQSAVKFVAGVAAYRKEVDEFRALVAQLESALSSSSSSKSKPADGADDDDDDDVKAIDAARERFNQLCNDISEKWPSFFASQTANTKQQQRPPWQLNYCAENDPFAPPESEDSKVTFDGGKILDRFGRDIWEDRCYALGVTVQRGAAVGVGAERFRSVTRARTVRSALWQRWVTNPWVASLPASVLDKLDRYRDDHFVKCFDHRVMAFLDIKDAVDAHPVDSKTKQRLRTAITQSLSKYANFPLLGGDSSSLGDFATFADVEAMAARILTHFTQVLGSSSKNKKKKKKIRCIAACIGDCPEWFVLDVTCAAAGIAFVGLHTSWPVEDLRRALAIVAPDVVLFHEDDAQKLRAAMRDDAPSSSSSMAETQVATFESLVRAGCFRKKADASSQQVVSLNAVLDQFSLLSDSDDDDDDDDDLFTLMFSSGTSGRLKAVEVTAAAWLATNFDTQKYDLDPFSVLSFNALAHGLDRGMAWTALFSAGRIAFVVADKSSDQKQQRLIAQLCDVVDSPPSTAAAASESSLHHHIPDCIVAANPANPSVLVASPDHWTALKHVLDRIGVSAFVERAAAVSETETETELDDAALARLRRINELLFGANLKQAGTGGAPVSPQVLRFFRRLLAFAKTTTEEEDEAIAKKKEGKQVKSAASSEEQQQQQQQQDNEEEEEEEQVGVAFVDVYGATEAPGISTDNVVRSSGLELALLPVAGYDLAAKCEGELVVRGSGVARKYRNALPGENEAAFLKDGWYRTGDVVHLKCGGAGAGAGAGGAELVREDLQLVTSDASDAETLHAVKISSSSSSSAVHLSVVDRVKDLIELYVDHQSAWVPATKVENALLLQSPLENDSDTTVEVEQAAVFGDRMLPFLVAVVGISAKSAAAFVSDGAVLALEAALLRQFRASVEALPHSAPCWVPQALALHVVADDGDVAAASSGDDSAKTTRLKTLPRWAHGSRFRTHLGKLRRGELKELLGDEVAMTFVKVQEQQQQ